MTETERPEGCTRSNYYMPSQSGVDTTSPSSQPTFRSIQVDGVNQQVQYYSRPYESAASHFDGSFTKTAQYFVGASSQEDMYSHNQPGMVTATSKPFVDSGGFPFVCGLCSLQFNKVLDFLSHFKVHNYQNISQENVHICGTLTESLIHTLGTVKSGNFFTCGVCTLPLPSLCLLHEHLVFVEKAASYTVNIRTRMTENISFSYRETSYHADGRTPPDVHSEKNGAILEPGYYVDTGVPDGTQQKLVAGHAANSGDDHVLDSALSNSHTGYKDVIHDGSTTVDDELVTGPSAPEETGTNQEQEMRSATNVSFQPTTDLPGESEHTFLSKHIEPVTEDTSNINDTGATPVHVLVSAAPAAETSTFTGVAPVVTERCTSPCEAGEINATDEDRANQQVEDTRHEGDLTESNTVTSTYTRRSARLKTSSSGNVIKCIKTTKQTSKEANTLKEAHTSIEAKYDLDNTGRTSEDNSDDDYVCRERKFDDPKRERRRLMMIKYQKNYRERKRLKRLGLWQAKHEATRSTACVATSMTAREKHSAADAKVPCDVCGLMFKKKNLRRHAETHSTDTAFQCDICYKTFKTKGYLYSHKLHHQTVRDLICDHCGKAFNNGPNLRQHLKIHVQPRALRCPLCPKMFRSNYVLKDHVMRHSEVKPHTCHLCGRTFKVAQEVRRHLAVHSEARPHVCRVCTKGFKCRSNLVKHEKIHTK